VEEGVNVKDCVYKIEKKLRADAFDMMLMKNGRENFLK